jgi:hypothetical protein
MAELEGDMEDDEEPPAVKPAKMVIETDISSVK